MVAVWQLLLLSLQSFNYGEIKGIIIRCAAPAQQFSISPCPRISTVSPCLRSPCHPEQSKQTNAIEVPLGTESPDRVDRGIRPRKHAGKVEHTYAPHSQ
jgi:hypothetical protein